VERNHKAGQNPPRVLAPIEEEEDNLLCHNVPSTWPSAPI